MKTAFLMAMLTAGSAVGHHSYGDYDRDAQVALEGIVQNVVWGNPHVLLTFKTNDKGEYSVEWGSVLQLNRQGIDSAPIKKGDRLIVTGSVNRNHDKHILTLVRKMSRASDGWQWVDPRFVASK